MAAADPVAAADLTTDIINTLEVECPLAGCDFDDEVSVVFVNGSLSQVRWKCPSCGTILEQNWGELE